MITELTPKQKEMIPVYREEYIKKGLNTAPINRKEAIKNINNLYTKISGRDLPKKVVFCNSPLEQFHLSIFYKIAQKIINKGGDAGFEEDLKKTLEDCGVDERAWNDTSREAWKTTMDALNISLDINVSSLVKYTEKKIKKHNIHYVHPYLYGCFDSYFFSFYSYFKEVVGIKYNCDEKYEIWRSLLDCGFIYPLRDICIVSEKPIEINRNRDGRLHADGKPALKFADGFSLWRLHGVRVPKEIVMTPADQLDPELALKETNADVQREIIRKVGYERVLQHCNAKTINEWTVPKTGLKYSLKTMKIGENIDRKYLCYEHASIPGVYYAKPVPPECAYCWQARAFQTKILTREEIKKANFENVKKDLPEWVV